MLRIATRQSPLALKQTLWVKETLQLLYPTLKISLVRLTTEGDQRLEISLAKIGGKGLFTKALEDALIHHEADIAVHSMKDVPSELPGGLGIGAICLREDPHDVLLSLKSYPTLQAMPEGAIIGTSSVRRQSQVLATRPDLQIKLLRGNVDTRIRKLEEGQYDAIILAAAGLKRLQFTSIKPYALPLESFVPCAGQGAIGIEYRLDDQATLNKIIQLNDLTTQQCVLAERTLNRYLGGSCQVPIGAYAHIQEGTLSLKAVIGKIDGSLLLGTEQTGSPENAVEIGVQAAEDLISQGADRILSTLND